MLIPLVPFAHHDCEWVAREKLERELGIGLPPGWERACLLGSAKKGKRRFALKVIIGVLLSPDSIIIETEGRGDWPTVLTYNAYGPTREDPIHVKFGDHQLFPVGKIVHACKGLCNNARPPLAP